jgi:vacuolar-type H+-ATPase subunit H
MAHGAGATPTASVEALKQLKSVELECEALLQQAKEATQSRVAKSREAAEVAYAQARAEADRLRETTLQAARTAAEREADQIVEAGESDAAKIAAESSKKLAALRAKLMATVLNEFWPESSGK